jgi:hypothetical protein
MTARIEDYARMNGMWQIASLVPTIIEDYRDRILVRRSVTTYARQYNWNLDWLPLTTQRTRKVSEGGLPT